VNWVEVVVGVVFIVWPLLYQRQIARIHDKMVARGGDAERFERGMDKPFLRLTLWVIPVLGVALLVAGLTGS
jgi:hypothetical protein